MTYTSTYNHANRLASISNGSMNASYLYNALDQRLFKTVDGQQTRFLVDSNGTLLQEIKGTQVKTYFYLAGQPLAVIINTSPSSASLYYFHNDHLGTPQVMTDEGQNIVWKASYTPFGQANLLINAVENNLRFPGQYFDIETGTHYNYHRDYDPELGRYLQSDPIGLAGGINTYAYVYQNPLRYTDPYGESALAGVLAGVGADIAIPDPTDLAWPKWAGFGLAITGAALYDVCNTYFSEPGKPTAEDGYKPPKKPTRGADKEGKVKNPNGRGKGWPDANGDVWVPTNGIAAHGGEHWDVQSPPKKGERKGKHRNVYPGGHVR